MRTFSAAVAVTSLLFAMGCDAGTGAGGDEIDGSAVTDAGADAGSSDDAATGGDATVTGDAAAAVDAGPAPLTYESVVIYDGSKAKPTLCAGTGPGADIDFIAVYRNKKLIGVGKVGSAKFSAGLGDCIKDDNCKKNEHNDANAAAAVTGGFGDICTKKGKAVTDCKDSDLSEGYLSLGCGSVELQVGACQKAAPASTDSAECDGSGELIELQAGDEIDVHEIGANYKSKYGMSCTCADEGFEVDVRATTGSETGSKVLGGANGGSKTFTVPADK